MEGGVYVGAVVEEELDHVYAAAADGEEECRLCFVVSGVVGGFGVCAVEEEKFKGAWVVVGDGPNDGRTVGHLCASLVEACCEEAVEAAVGEEERSNGVTSGDLVGDVEDNFCGEFVDHCRW